MQGIEREIEEYPEFLRDDEEYEDMLGKCLSDEELVAQIKGGDVQSFEILKKKYSKRLLFFAWKILKDKEDAEDAIQESFIKIHGALKGYEEMGAFLAWMYKIVRNVCLDFIKRRDKREEFISNARLTHYMSGENHDTYFSPRYRDEDPEVIYERKQVLMRLRKVLDEMSDEFREPFEMAFYEGRSYKEIAAITDSPLGTVMSRIHRVRKIVKRELLEFFKQSLLKG